MTKIKVNGHEHHLAEWEKLVIHLKLETKTRNQSVKCNPFLVCVPGKIALNLGYMRHEKKNHPYEYSSYSVNKNNIFNFFTLHSLALGEVFLLSYFNNFHLANEGLFSLRPAAHLFVLLYFITWLNVN